MPKKKNNNNNQQQRGNNNQQQYGNNQQQFNNNNQRSNPAGVNTKQNYPNNRGNGGQFFCTNHGTNTSHNTAGCKQNPNVANNNNNNNTPQGKKAPCTKCGKNGHIAANCWSNTPQNQQQNQNSKTPPPAYTYNDPNQRNFNTQHANNYYSAAVSNATDNYCGHCNVQGHNPSTCSNTTGCYDNFRSRLLCLSCQTKGHVADDCNNPLSTQCTKCYRKGHNSAECRLNPDRDAQVRLALAARNTKQRYIWRQPEFEQHASQRAEAEYEEAKRIAALSGVPITAEDDYNFQRNIYLASQVFGTNPFIDTAARLGADVRGNAVGGVPNIPAPQNVAPKVFTPHPKPYNMQYGHNLARANGAVKNNNLAKQRAFLDRMHREGAPIEEIKWFEQQIYERNQQQKTDLEKEIEKKIEASKCYVTEFVNDEIRKNEALICQKVPIHQSRMDEVKYLMSQGASFFRDPEAMKALFQRYLPRCKKCCKDGFIVDRYFNVIEPTMQKTDMLRLFDANDWGIFIAFKCSCSRTYHKTSLGYEFLLLGAELYDSLPPEEQ